MSYEQRFFSALQEQFIGTEIEGEGGYVNLMSMKTQYFSKITSILQEAIEREIDEENREEFYTKAFTFFDCYFNETGTVFLCEHPNPQQHI